MSIWEVALGMLTMGWYLTYPMLIAAAVVGYKRPVFTVATLGALAIIWVVFNMVLLVLMPHDEFGIGVRVRHMAAVISVAYIVAAYYAGRWWTQRRADRIVAP